MGDYTAIYGELILEKDVADEIATAVNGHLYLDLAGLRRVRRLRKHPDVVGLLQRPRVGQIGSMSSAYHTADRSAELLHPTQDLSLIARRTGKSTTVSHQIIIARHALRFLSTIEGEFHLSYVPHERRLKMYCSLKDYHGESDALARVAPLLATEGFLFRQREWENSKPIYFSYGTKSYVANVQSHITDLSERRPAEGPEHLPLTYLSAATGPKESR